MKCTDIRLCCIYKDNMAICNQETLKEWFSGVATGKIEPTLVYYVGDIGTGKKTYIDEMVNLESYKCININCIYDKDHSRLKKKTFVSELSHIVTNRNIEYFLTGVKDIVVIHNLHVVTDKVFFDDLMTVKNTVKFVTPVVCILNKHFISERFLTYMTKGSSTFYHQQKTIDELTCIAAKVFKEYGIVSLPDKFQDKINKCDGNIYFLLTQVRQFALASRFCDDHTSDKLDKNIVTKCFDDLCSTEFTWYKKQEIIKSQGSLVRLLMPNHIFCGLDKDDTKNPNDKFDIGLKCMETMAFGETVTGSNYAAFTSLLQCIYPTIQVQNSTIKSMVLSNCQSSSNMDTLPRLLYPHTDDQFIFIVYCIVESIELEQARKKTKDEIPWTQWLPRISKLGLNELQQKHFKILNTHNITKKKINRFLSRIRSPIPDDI